MSKTSYLIIGVVFGLALVMAGWYGINQNYTYQGVLIDPPAVAADFKLSDQDGNPFRLSDQRGKITLIFFGYTRCPDVCPVTLSEYKQIKAQLDNLADQFVFVFITVDPERDTQEQLKSYMANFDPTFYGLTGSEQDLEAVYQAYGVYRERQDVGSAAGYLMDHTARIYVVDRSGSWRINYPFGMQVDKIVRDLQHLAAE